MFLSVFLSSLELNIQKPTSMKIKIVGKKGKEYIGRKIRYTDEWDTSIMTIKKVDLENDMWFYENDTFDYISEMLKYLADPNSEYTWED